MDHLRHPWGPIVSGESHTLILGSFPSVKSRKVSFFYGHPQNRFWPMLAAVFGEKTPAAREEKTSLVLRHGLALWDVIGECEIIGSSDSSVRNAKPVDIRRVTDAAHIRRVLCNGALSGKLYAKHLQPVLAIPALVLPSTSPANAAWRMDRLVEAWRSALIESPV